MKYIVTIQVEVNLDNLYEYDRNLYLMDTTPDRSIPDGEERTVAQVMAADYLERGLLCTAREYVTEVTSSVAPKS